MNYLKQGLGNFSYGELLLMDWRAVGGKRIAEHAFKELVDDGKNVPCDLLKVIANGLHPRELKPTQGEAQALDSYYYLVGCLLTGKSKPPLREVFEHVAGVYGVEVETVERNYYRVGVPAMLENFEKNMPSGSIDENKL
jgi:hypothetical protein